MYCSNCGKKLEDGEVCLCEKTAEISVNANNPEKKNTSIKKLVIAVIVGTIISIISFVAVSVAISVIFEKASENNSPEAGEVNIFEGIEGDFVLEQSGTEYSEGEVNGNTYSNRWADFTLTLDSRFAQGTQEEYEAYETLLYDCGAYFYADDDGDEVTILFYDSGSFSVKEYAEECLADWEYASRDSIAQVYSESFAQGITYRREARTVEIAGKEYLAVYLIAEKDGEVFIVYGDFCAKMDGRIIDISFSVDSIEESLELAEKFISCNGQAI